MKIAQRPMREDIIVLSTFYDRVRYSGILYRHLMGISTNFNMIYYDYFGLSDGFLMYPVTSRNSYSGEKTYIDISEHLHKFKVV